MFDKLFLRVEVKSFFARPCHGAYDTFRGIYHFFLVVQYPSISDYLLILIDSFKIFNVENICLIQSLVDLFHKCYFKAHVIHPMVPFFGHLSILCWTTLK